MPRWVPITKERHGTLRFRPPESYAFASTLTMVPVVLAELPRLVPFYPLVFVRREDQAFGLYALLGLDSGRNLFVDPNSGRWLAEYIPAAVRAHPFRMALGQQSDQWILCVDEEAGVLYEGSVGSRFFEKTGKPARWVLDMMGFLQQIMSQELLTAAACFALNSLGLIVPWPLTLRTPQGDRTLEGLYQVDENGLQKLDGDALRELRDAGALAAAYAQRFSAWHVHTLGRLLSGQAPKREEGPPVTPSGELDLSFLG